MTITHNGKNIPLTTEMEKVILVLLGENLQHRTGYERGNESEIIKQNNDRANKLIEDLKRFSAEHEGWKINWEDDGVSKYHIYFDHINKCLDVDYNHSCDIMCVYFYTEEIAQQAIEQFKDELLWYYTEYKWVL